MAGFGDLVQKAFYMGVGLASYAGEQANERLVELREKSQKLADELVARGEMNAEEARRFVEDMVRQGQQTTPRTQVTKDEPKAPRRIEILDDEETTTSSAADTSAETAGNASGADAVSEADNDIDTLRQQVRSLQDDLRRLQKDQ